MSDAPQYPSQYPARSHGSNPWSISKIVEQITGKRLEEFQERPRADAPKQASATPALPSFLPPVEKPLYYTYPAQVKPAKGPSPEEPVPEHRGRKLSRKEVERKYLAYLMFHMEHLTDPALKHLRLAVEEECHNRGINKK
jgi:hypothetical protein